MKLDLTDPLVLRIVQDDRPIALRKRRRSVVDKNLTAIEDLVAILPPQAYPKTPSKSKKKVRFSDPGPQIECTTGLTPALRSTSLGAPFGVIDGVEIPYTTPSSRRRTTLPPINTNWASDAVEVKFAPIRQLLTPRLKRQLARRDISNEMNAIEDNRRVIDKQREELQDLRQELIELRRIQTPADKTFIEDSYTESSQVYLGMSPPALDRDVPSIPDSQNEDSMLSISSEACLDNAVGIFIDPDVQRTEDHQSNNPPKSRPECTTFKVDQSIQTDPLLDELKDHIAEQTVHLTKARLELERIFPGETILPLIPPANGDCSALLNAMLRHLQTAHTSLRTTKQSLSNMESQKNSLQGNFNQSLAKLDVARESYAELLRGARAGAEKYAQARERITSLEAEVDDGNRSSEKLRAALDTYRGEVHALESLIIRLEEDGRERLEKMKGEMDEAVADLECMVAAETRGRREAENELDSRALQIRVLEGSQKELKEAISEKQAIVRSLEEELSNVRSGKEQEIGHLNVRIARLEEELASARTDITALELEKAELIQLSSSRHSTELKTIDQLKHELRRAVRGVEGIVGGWEREIVQDCGESIRVAGLMTPSIGGGRFRDLATDTVEGEVQVRRGKSRRSRKVDSAIGLLEEDIMDDA